MATWSKSRVDYRNVNGGNEFEDGDGVRASDINKVFNGIFYTQDNLENQLANLGDGTPKYVALESTILSKTSNEGVLFAGDTQHKYFWNGAHYVDGGVYSGVGDYENEVNHLKNGLVNIPLEWIEHSAQDWSLNPVTNPNNTISNIITVKGKLVIELSEELVGSGLELMALSKTGGSINRYDYSDYMTNGIIKIELEDECRIQVAAGVDISHYFTSIINGVKAYTLTDEFNFKYLKNKIIGSKKISCFGDSLTAGVITGTTTITESYPYWLKKFLENDNVVVENRGVPGATVQDMYKTISNLTAVYDGIDIAILMIGTNGYITKDNISYYYACIESLINNSKGKCKIIIVNPPKSIRDGVPTRWLDEMHYNIMGIAQKYNLPCIDLYQMLPFTPDNNLYYSPDKVHFTKVGYYYVAFIIYNYLVNNMTSSLIGGNPTFDY